MPIKVLRLTCLLLAISLATLAQGLEIPGVPTDSGEQKTAAPPEMLPVPEPGQLKANWWDYFQAQEEALGQRIQTVLERLSTLEKEIPAELVAQTGAHLERLRTNLTALPQARAQTASPAPVSPTYQQSYSLQSFLDKARNLRKAQAEWQQDREDVAQTARAIKAAEQRLDNLLAAYLALELENTERIPRGLEIMADRSVLEIDKQRQRVRKAILETHEIYTNQLEDELEIVKQRLTVSKRDLEESEKAIAEAGASREQTQNQFLKAQVKAMGVVGDTPQEKAEFRYREQQVVHAAVETALSEVTLAHFQLQKYLSLLLSAPEGLDVDTLRAQVRDMNVLLQELNERTANWIKASNRERNQASEALATESEDEEPDARREFDRINQQRLRLSQDTLLRLERLENATMDLRLLNEALAERLLEHEGYLQTGFAWVQQTLADYWQTSLGWFSLSLFKISDTPVTIMGLLRVLLILFIAWSASQLLRRTLNRIGKRRRSLNQAALYTIGRLAHYAIIIIGLIIGLSSIGLDFTNFALVAGALSVGIGFGLQATVNNFVSGLIILFERNLKVGDFIELDAELTGEVKEINVRSTLINTNDNVDIVVPNSELVSSRVINWTLREAYRRIRIPFGVAYGSDIDVVEQAVLEAATKVTYTQTGRQDREPRVWMTSFGDSSLNFMLGVWIMSDAVKQPTTVHSVYLREIEKAFRRYGVEIPFPQRDLHLRSGFKEQSLPVSQELNAASAEA